jgi:hypothetical protein
VARDLLTPAVAGDPAAAGLTARLCVHTVHRPSARPAARQAGERVPPASDFGAAHWRHGDGWDDADDWDDHGGRFADHPH